MAQKKEKARSDGKPKEDRDKDFKFIVRLFNSDINGERTIKDGLTSIPGISYRLSEVLTRQLGRPPDMKIGNLTDEDVQTLGQIIEELPSTFPSWMLNRQKDFETGDDTHVLGVNVDIQHKDDIGELRKSRCYRGIRHDNGHKVRGQRTSSNGRRGSTIGVTRKTTK